ncbi:MAG: cell division protein ZapA [Ruminococcaceae bacterium]|nr:cell division protein ZapA [Oscillospiraceae bacterium]
MPEQNKLVVKINGQEYTITSEESREYMLGVADLVDKTMKQVNQSNPGLSTAMTAVLSALNLADDYIRLKRSDDALAKNIVKYTDRIKALEEQLAKLTNHRP